MSPPKAEILSNIFIAFEKLLKRRTIEWPENRHIYCSDSIRIKQKEKCRLKRLKTLQKCPKNVNSPATSRKVITQDIETRHPHFINLSVKSFLWLHLARSLASRYMKMEKNLVSCCKRDKSFKLHNNIISIHVAVEKS